MSVNVGVALARLAQGLKLTLFEISSSNQTAPSGLLGLIENSKKNFDLINLSLSQTMQIAASVN